MKTIGDLFKFNTHGLYYANISVYIYDSHRCSIPEVWSDTGYDISFKKGTNMDAYEYLPTIRMSDIAEDYCRNENIRLDEELIIYADDESMTVKDIRLDFDNNSIYLII